MDELDAMAKLASVLDKVDDTKVRDRILSWAWDKYSSVSKPTAARQTVPKAGIAKKGGKKSRKGKKKPSLVKGLNLFPKGKQSFSDFANEKKPTNHDSKNTVAVYYLANELAISGITADHIYTCYKAAKWPFPSSLANSLQQTSSRQGYLDTSDGQNITVTPAGENLVTHELPKETEGD